MLNQWNRTIAVLSIILLYGCSHPGCPDLQRMASALEEPWPRARPLTLTMSVQRPAGRFVLHCRLTNASDQPIRLDRSGLPWNQPIFFHGTLVTATGATSHLFAAVIIGYLRPGPALFDLAPGATVEGDFEPRLLPGSPLTYERTRRDQDALLLWSYSLEFTLDASSAHEDLVGATFLPQSVMQSIPGS